ncbi:hypothetical protein PTTG_06731 [Puccinia triticina 1-1 BBBD Race 1]|uniref:tRNA pseudouridylate synthase 2 n=1 Tax=Puccinia triticina (isolate 1-1 / race 1 (BBBD)) TaxID=630390 RepID=A0A180GMK3_PUCT1|nr:hypothetical protein PTTG_06731 [Puccinia triticina 1-1 BBBD Race 1]
MGSSDDSPAKRKRADEDPPSSSRLPKRRVAVLVGYYGRGYQGSQINPHTTTIEGTLFRAFVHAGCITQDNASHPTKVGLQRAARTDANVSACCNLISLKLILNPPGIEQQPGELDPLHKALIEQHSQTSHYPLIRHINRFLPAELRVWEILRVQNSFNPRSLCDSRVYEYSLPTWLFLPPKPGSPLHQRFSQNHAQGIGQEDPEAAWWDVHSDLLEKDFKAIQAERRGSYRISHTMIARIQAVLDQYKGTHNFHNLTVAKAFTERNAVRIMKHFSVSEPFLVAASDPNDHPTEWISITFHGQSFMLHQIRKMIGLLVLVCRTRTPVTIINKLYGPKKVSIPKAPGIGLILRKLHFDGYNKKIHHINQQTLNRQQKRRKGPAQKGGNSQEDDQLMVWDSIDCSRFDALFERFKRETLFHRIFLNQPSQPSNEPQNSKPAQPISADDEKVGPVEVVDPKKVEEELAGSKDPNPAPTRGPAKRPKHGQAPDDEDDEDDEAHADEETDFLPAENQEGEDPFGVWMNYMDVYTGADLDFLDPKWGLPDQ